MKMDNYTIPNEFTLQDLKLPPSINQLFQSRDSNEGVKISTPNSNDFLITVDSVLYWYKGDLLTRRLVYTSKILNAFFTYFKNDLQRKALVILLRDTANVYYSDGKSCSLSFPFKILNGLPCPNGVILQKEETVSNNSISFLTLLEPMAEFGTVISSTTSNISSQEQLILFPTTKNSSISLSHNEIDGTLNFYHTRFLNRHHQKNTPTLSNTYHTMNPNSNEQIPKRKVSRKVSASTNQVNPEDKMVDDDLTIKMEKRRGVSYSETLSIDRMASYDFYSNRSKSSEPYSNISSGSPSFDLTTLRKDSILSKFYCAKIGNLQNYKSHSMCFDSNRQSIFIKTESALKVFIFDCDSLASLPKLVNAIDLSDGYSDYSILDELPGFVLLVEKNTNNLVIYNPFLSIELSVFKSSHQIREIYDTFGSSVFFRNSHNEILKIRLNLKPTSQLVQNLIGSLKFLMNSYSFNYIQVIWIYAFALLKRDWEAFVLTILSVILPMSIEDGQIDDSNVITVVLSQIRPLQSKLLKDQFSLYQLSPNIIMTLHLVCEDLKLNILSKSPVSNLKLFVSQLIRWIGWNEHWASYYDDPRVKFNKLIRFPVPQISQTPPDLFKSLNSLFEDEIVPYLTFSQLSQESEIVDEKVTPRSYYILRLFETIISPDFNPVDVVSLMIEYNITLSDLETYPIGVLIPLKESIAFCQENLLEADVSFDKEFYKLIDRKDLSKLVDKSVKRNSRERAGNLNHGTQTLIQTKDMHQIVNAINESQEPTAPLEHDRFQITKLIFNEDRRFYEISKILQTFQTQSVICNSIGSLPEKESLAKRKKLASLVALRTLTISLGRSIMLYSSKEPLITEKFPIPKLTFSIQILPDSINVHLEKDTINSNCLQWGYFHSGASAAVTISKSSKGISGSWVVFNKPKELNAQHGGFLLGLGLNGHLKNLEEWNIYNYLGPKHLYTSIGLLLGMSASLRGTMDVKLTKVLSVHVVALLPPGASDLIVSSPVQTAGLIGIGLLYLESQHRRMSEILLSQINGTISIEEQQVAEESYRLAAGISLGYVNLGKGDDLKGLNDTHVVDKLLSIAITMKDVQTNESFDKSMNGALLALAFIYLRTNNEIIAKKLQIPEANQLLDYFRPDVSLLRVLAKNLIMWDSIGNSADWINSQLPKNLLGDDKYTNPNFHNVVAGLCLSISLKYSSTGDITARDSVLYFYDKFCTISANYGFNDSYDVKVLQNSLSRLQVILAICLSLIMASTGDLETFRRLRILHGEFKDNDENDNTLYGKFMAINMALGFLFMSGGQFAIMTHSNFAIASLVTSIYPIFPKTDDTYQPEVHLQALRHFWCMAIERRCLVVRDIESMRPVATEVSIVLKNGKKHNVRTPSLLPSLNTIEEIKLLNIDEHFKLKIKDLEILNNNGLNVYVYKKTKLKPLQKSIELILEGINDAFDEKQKNVDSLVNLSIFKKFSKDDLHRLLFSASAQPSSSSSFLGTSTSSLDSLNSNIIDKQLELFGMVTRLKSMDDLWNLKLVFAYYDRMLSGEDAYYFSIEFIDDLKRRLWVMSKQFT